MSIRRNPYYKEAGDSFELLRDMFLVGIKNPPEETSKAAMASKLSALTSSPQERNLSGVRYQRVNGDIKVTLPEDMTAEEAVVCLSAAATYFANESGLDSDEVFTTFMSALVDSVFKIVGKMIRDLRSSITGKK